MSIFFRTVRQVEQRVVKRTPLIWLAGALTLLPLSWPGDVGAQAQSAAAPRSIVVRAQRMLDVKSGTFLEDVAVHVEGERIKAVGAAMEILKQAPGVPVLDLGSATLLP